MYGLVTTTMEVCKDRFHLVHYKFYTTTAKRFNVIGITFRAALTQNSVLGSLLVIDTNKTYII